MKGEIYVSLVAKLLFVACIRGKFARRFHYMAFVVIGAPTVTSM
jgi:hypothetical protein